MRDGIKPLAEVRADGARRRRLDGIRAQLHEKDKRRWNIGAAIAGGIYASCLTIILPLFPVYGLYGALSAWYIAHKELRFFGGLLCYGGGHALLVSIFLATGLQDPHFFMAVMTLSIAIGGGIIGLASQLREWHIERALTMLDDPDVVVHEGDQPKAPKISPTPELHPDITRPGYVEARAKTDEAIPFVAANTHDEQPDDTKTDTVALPEIIDDEGFTAPG